MTALSSLAVLALLAAPSETVLVQFASQQCPHCRAMEPVLSRLAAEGCAVHVIDVNQQPDVARQFHVTGVPTFVALTGGRESGRVVGATTYERLTELWGRTTSAAAASAPENASAVETATRASVRLRVEDAGGYGFGTGTIIDTHEGEALVVTCGHLFRQSQGKGKISADLFTGGTTKNVEGQLLAYDLDRDIALISIRTPITVQPATVAPPGHAVRPGDRAFTIGCDKGAEPSVRQTQITAVNKYRGKPNYTAAGMPVDGRSGGGLFTADGLLIGVCNAADPADNEGLYAGLASIHWQLDQIGQSEVYQRAARSLAAAEHRPAPAAQRPPVQAASPPQLPAQMPGVTRDGGSDGAAFADGLRALAAHLPEDLAPSSDADEMEIVFIVRSKRNPQKTSEVYLVDRASPELVAQVRDAARTTGQRRAVFAGGRSADPPIVRGQSAENEGSP